MKGVPNILYFVIGIFVLYFIYMYFRQYAYEGFAYPPASDCQDGCRIACAGYPCYCQQQYLDDGLLKHCKCRWSNEKGTGVPTESFNNIMDENNVPLN